MKTNKKRNHDPVGLSAKITRRDFIGATLIGAGAALLHAVAPAAAQELGPAWTGYGGVGDYRFSNGNTADVVLSGHRIQDHTFGSDPAKIIDTGESYDVLIVGGGFAGLSAMYEFKKREPNGKCLLLDDHLIFGGMAKQNEFDVDGYRLVGPQLSPNFMLPDPASRHVDGYWDELGLPRQFKFAERDGGDPSIVFPKATSSAMYFAEQCATIGYYFQNQLTKGKGVWVKDIWNDDLRRAPWPSPLKKDLLALRDTKKNYRSEKEEPAWLDSMTYGDFVIQVMGLSREVLTYITPILGVAGQSPAVSAYAAALYGMPGVSHYPGRSLMGELGDRWMSFPGGNATLARYFVKSMIPDAIQGPKTFEAIANNSVNFSALDRDGAALRVRLGATALRIGHEGEATKAEHVNLVYEKKGKLYSVKAKAAVLAIGGFAAKYVVTDLLEEYRTAFSQFLYSPMLMVNVALHNWRFLDRLGFSAARWFDGFGFYSTLRQPMLVGQRPTPFHPDKPIIMTFYVPIQHPNLPLVEQGPANRMELYNTSYADYERRIVAQMQRLFTAGGFNARRDIAGIVLTRWGHAWLSPPPGFFFPEDGKPAPFDVIRRRFGRIAFGHSELAGNQGWTTALAEGKRALTQVLEAI